ncbi:MAG TPA: sulfatase [Solirubrobacteraceae bacterium]
MLTGRFRWGALATLAFAGLLAALTLVPSGASAHHRRHHKKPHRKPHRRRRVGHRAIPRADPSRPNIVFVLTDDLSMNLLQYMPTVEAMQRQGMTFDNYFVSDSLCCPSRASIFTGNFPHDTGVYTNAGRHGGFNQFYARGEEQHTFARALQSAGYRTAMMGKYLNGYMSAKGRFSVAPATYVPPGWNQWDVAGWGYPEFHYVLNENGRLQPYGDQPSDYLTDVLSAKATNFIDTSAGAHQPFFLEMATFAPHRPYTPAPRNRDDFPGLRVPQTASFNRLPINAPGWLAHRQPLDAAQIDHIDRAYRKRAQSVEAVDAMLSQIEGTLQADGIADNTYVVFSSDNGLHMGEYRLMPGKETAFDTDVHVPLIVTGPGVPAGVSTDSMAENIDLAKTFAQLGGTDLASDGHSLLPLLNGNAPIGWRNAILIEHHHPPSSSGDPDFQGPGSGNPPSYEAMRTPDFLYVEYATGARELYDLRIDPSELDNLAPYLSSGELAQFHSALVQMEACHGSAACWAAMHVTPATGAAVGRARARAARP